MTIVRLTQDPILSVKTHPQAGDNLNGPSLIRAPEWLARPLGRYYLYFAHHNGRHIRLAYADSLTGPWQVYEPGVLPLSVSGFEGHIASPDVHVDNRAKRIQMYFHGSDSETDASSPQFTRAAVSRNGLDFEVVSDNLGGAYWRVFRLRDWFYALEMPGIFRRSRDPYGPFEQGPQVFASGMRHSAVSLRNDLLDVFYSNIGDCPERILHATIDVRGEWVDWKTKGAVTIANPSGPAEGGDCMRVPSRIGIAKSPVNELRDPAVYSEEDTRYLLFSVAGEQGIAIARIDE